MRENENTDLLKEESGGSAGNVARGVSCSWQFPGVTYEKEDDPVCSFLHGLILSSLQFLLLPITLCFLPLRK